MITDINEIKILRKKLGLTQFQLAKKSAVSQSLIAKIESKKLDPTYSKVKKIFQTLEDLSKKNEIKASQIMKKKIITTTPDSDIKEVIKLMKKHNISQMPVEDNGNCVGVVTETTLLDAIIDSKGKIVKDIMDEIPPIVSKQTCITTISNLLKTFPMVVIADQGKINGIITKSDIINKLYD